MNSREYAADLDVVKAAVRRAGAAIMRSFGTELAVTHKSPGQPVTAADLEADALLREALGDARPDYGWLSEETADGPDRLRCARVWIVDPIDGTRSFIARRPEFTISVGLAEDGRAVAGVVCNPARDELFCAVRGAGAFLETPGRAPVRLRVREPEMEDPITVLASRTEMAAGELVAFRDGWRVEPLGSTAYKLASVAAGRAGAYVSRGPKSEWDVCAGVLLMEEAGGRATDVYGGEVRFNRPDTSVRGMLAAGTRLHGALLRHAAGTGAARPRRPAS